MSKPAYLVGIDLGTTHIAVAYAAVDQPPTAPAVFPIPQLLAPGQVGSSPLLPSVRYHPADGELAPGEAPAMFADGTAILGQAARFLAAKTSGRLVTSAKSWLSHPHVDPGADILPWGSADDVVKISPLAASAGYLSHISRVWTRQFSDAPLAEQEIAITVPASFDESARALTMEAARMAGLEGVRLLEEPQAAFYDWLRRHRRDLKPLLAAVRLVLVCDIGGGTTDFTLIKVEPSEHQEPRLTRIAVGDHLMLGGDNIDLAVAHLAESRLLAPGKKLSASELSQLLEQCRLAKERLLADSAPEQATVTLLGGGSRLIGGTRSVALTRDEVRALVLDGFFPLTALDELPDRKRSGVVEFGLPYAAEPAVSRHIAAFLTLHRNACLEALGGESSIPDAILFNGGVVKSGPIRQRLQALLTQWSRDQALSRNRPVPPPPRLLDNPEPELAVAFGAAAYLQSRRGRQPIIGGGAARSYFLLIDTGADGENRYGVCLLPKGSPEGEERVLQDRRFLLRLGQPVRFHLLSLSGDARFRPGEVVEISPEFQSLPPLAAVFEAAETGAEAEVALAVMQTEIGTLKIQCVDVKDHDRRWNVEFQIRKKTPDPAAGAALPPEFSRAAEKIQAVFGAKSRQIDPKAVRNLRADLEKTFGRPRSDWDSALLRALFSLLLEGARYRRRSDSHERLWLSLTGYCLRPGFGHPLDDWRVDQLWKLYPAGIQFVTESQNWAEWWTLWRRIAGGVTADAQRHIFDDIARFIDPASARQPSIAKQGKNRSYDDMVKLSAVLERLSAEAKTQLGGWLLKRLQKGGESVQSWWALGRVGARVPFHGGSHQVLAPAAVGPWLAVMLALDWKKTPQIGFAATLLARKCGDRARDIDEDLRLQIIDKLKLARSPSSWLELVTDVKDLDEKEEQQIFGEALPPGLKLL